jgi:adenylosuccinate synthase
MSVARAVIGAGYGDEGKGLITDFLAAVKAHETLVVRYNGGAQAGHTVVAPDGRRHVFSHFGSGALAGARTYLSRFFVANPLLFLQERAQLQAIGVSGAPLRPFIDERTLITTPFDMLINQIAETSRGAGRHGSVGIGFGETIERNLLPQFGLAAGDLFGAEHDVRLRLSRLLTGIRTEWVPRRLAQLALAPSSARNDVRALLTLIESSVLAERWISDTVMFSKGLELSSVDPLRHASRLGSLVFEGAQGLLLDQDRGAFPYVTRSNTGLKNVLVLAAEAGIDTLEAIYVTRAYATRHGTGPFAHETVGPPYPGVRDDTNIVNDFQGSLRFGRLDLDLLAGSIANDLADARTSAVRVSIGLALTCLDQTGGRNEVIVGGGQRCLSEAALVQLLREKTGLGRLFVSHGPTRLTVVEPARFPLRPAESNVGVSSPVGARNT